MGIRVVLAEDNTLLREGVAQLLERADDIELVGTAVDRPSLEALIEAESPDLVVTDIRMPPTGTDEGIQIAAQLRETRPEVGVVVLSQYADPAYALALLEGGSEGRAYLLKERVSDVDDLLAAIREVASGGSVIDSKVVESLVSTKRPATQRHRPADPAGAGDPRRDGAGQEQCGDRGSAGPLHPSRGEAHQLDLLEARPVGGDRRQPAREGGAVVPGRRVSGGG